MNKKGLKITIEGRVQGVFFRSYSKERALELSLTGWVKNEPSGDVAIIAEGEEDNLLRFIEWCKEGPELAMIDIVNFEWLAYTGDYQTFEIKR